MQPSWVSTSPHGCGVQPDYIAYAASDVATPCRIHNNTAPKEKERCGGGWRVGFPPSRGQIPLRGRHSSWVSCVPKKWHSTLVVFTAHQTSRFRGQFRNGLSFFLLFPKKLLRNLVTTLIARLQRLSFSFEKLAEFEFHFMRLQRREMQLIR